MVMISMTKCDFRKYQFWQVAKKNKTKKIKKYITSGRRGTYSFFHV